MQVEVLSTQAHPTQPQLWQMQKFNIEIKCKSTVTFCVILIW